MDQKKMIEAALFVSTRPLMLNELSKISGLHSLGYLKDLMEELVKEYSERGIMIVNTPQGWEMQVNKEVLPVVAHLNKHADIPEGSKRTLALVVYKEPVMQAEIIKIQGNKAYAYIKDLKRRGLILVEKKGRTKILKLTKEFEDYFGQDKESIKEQLRKEQGTS